MSALIVAVGGSAIAVSKQRGKRVVRPAKKSVGAKQLKRKAVKSRHIARNAINGRKVRNGKLTGADVDVAKLGTVPAAGSASQAGNVNTISGRAASCPGGTVLVRGTCFDAQPNAPVTSVRKAADGCAAKGGYLPSPAELYMARGSLNLGSGTSPDFQFTDAYYSNTSGSAYRTVVVYEGGLREHPVDVSPAEYTCSYPLVR